MNPFKVICINSGATLKCRNSERIAAGVIEGHVYSVLETKEAGGSYFYILREMEPDIGYEISLFAPVSEIDETNMERNYNLEKI